MVPTKLDEAFVQCVCDDLFVMRARIERAIEDGLQLKGGTHTPQLEVAQEQVTVGEPSSLAVPVEYSIRGVSHRSHPSAPHRSHVRTESLRRRHPLACHVVPAPSFATARPRDEVADGKGPAPSQLRLMARSTAVCGEAALREGSPPDRRQGTAEQSSNDSGLGTTRPRLRYGRKLTLAVCKALAVEGELQTTPSRSSLHDLFELLCQILKMICPIPADRSDRELSGPTGRSRSRSRCGMRISARSSTTSGSADGRRRTTVVTLRRATVRFVHGERKLEQDAKVAPERKGFG